MQCLGVSNECCMGDNQLPQSAGCVPVNIARMLLAFFKVSILAELLPAERL